MTYMLLLNYALKLVEEIILYYDARSEKHQIVIKFILICTTCFGLISSHHLTIILKHLEEEYYRKPTFQN